MSVLKIIFPIRLICIILYVQIIELCFCFSLYDAQQLVNWLAWLPLLMLPYLLSGKKWVFKIVASIIFIENLLNLIHIIIVKGPLTVSSLFIIANTNLLESTEFLGLKLGFHFLLLLPYIALFVFSLLKIPQKFSIKNKKSIIFLIIPFIFSTIYLSDNIIHKRFVRKALPTSTKTIIEFQKEIKIYKALKSREIIKVNALSKNENNCRKICVLVIGESANRNHLGLYGYYRNTTPKFSARNDIFVFSDVVSPFSNTLTAVLALYTETTLENPKTIDESISLLDISYSAGYKTYWLSNQSPVGIWDNGIFNIAQTAENVQFVNISSNSSFETTLKKSYDELLLPKLFTILKNNNSENLFITIHLMGSHSSYPKRYPPDFEQFKDNTDKNKNIIAQYDNSILYTDYVLDSMINILNYFSQDTNTISSFVYCSDHGENLFEYNNTAGHDWSGYLPDCIVEIPFVIWLSDNYKKKYPEKTNNILNNKDLPFMSDNLFQVVLDIQDIETQYFDASKSIINQNYKIPEKRVLEDKREYKNK